MSQTMIGLLVALPFVLTMVTFMVLAIRNCR